MEPAGGVERPVFRRQFGCSAIELHRPGGKWLPPSIIDAALSGKGWGDKVKQPLATEPGKLTLG